MNPDVVYVVRPGEQNEELRYSLRSLSNLPHGKVWIVGYCPKWVTGVEVIATQVKPGGHQQVKANLRAACEHPDISEQFIYFNDDFFVMQPVESLPVMHLGPLTEAIKTAGMASAYTRAMKATLSILEEQGITEPLTYDLHAPMTVTKTGMLQALDLCSYPMVQERTLFGNLNHVGGERRHNHKVYRMVKGWQLWPFLSTNDQTFRSQPVGEYIRARFTTMSPYEMTPPVLTRTPSRSLPPRRPVRYTVHSTIRRIQRVAA
jgi:hypothetical protein